MQQKRNINQFIAQNYIQVYDWVDEDYPAPHVTIFKPKVMKELPQALIDYLVSTYRSNSFYPGRRSFGGNCDWGIFDAFYVMKYFKKEDQTSQIRIYVTSILRRPFTDQQQKYYETFSSVQPPQRIYHIYDSANDDNDTSQL